jgi:hypothetical protein
MPGNITFQTDSADLSADFYPILDRVSATLVEYDQTVVEVAGHADSVGTSEQPRAVGTTRSLGVGLPDEPWCQGNAPDHRGRRRGSPGGIKPDR